MAKLGVDIEKLSGFAGRAVTARAWTRSGFPAIAVVHRTKP